MAEIYLNSGAPTSAKNLSASTLCRNFLDGHFCNTPIDISLRLCERCRERGHANSCPSPQQECTCGFSRLFWAEVRLWAEAHAAGMELGAGCLLKGRENLSPAGGNSRRDESVSRHSTPNPSKTEGMA